jgi:hypothetical protein
VLVSVSTHELPQFELPGAQSSTHAELAQTSPAAQATLQPPQCRASELVSTQVPSQAAKPALQATTHSPSTHRVRPFAAGAQAAPQSPQ